MATAAGHTGEGKVLHRHRASSRMNRTGSFQCCRVFNRVCEAEAHFWLAERDRVSLANKYAEANLFPCAVRTLAISLHQLDATK